MKYAILFLCNIFVAHSLLPMEPQQVITIYNANVEPPITLDITSPHTKAFGTHKISENQIYDLKLYDTHNNVPDVTLYIHEAIPQFVKLDINKLRQQQDDLEIKVLEENGKFIICASAIGEEETSRIPSIGEVYLNHYKAPLTIGSLLTDKSVNNNKLYIINKNLALIRVGYQLNRIQQLEKSKSLSHFPIVDPQKKQVVLDQRLRTEENIVNLIEKEKTVVGFFPVTLYIPQALQEIISLTIDGKKIKSGNTLTIEASSETKMINIYNESFTNPMLLARLYTEVSPKTVTFG